LVGLHLNEQRWNGWTVDEPDVPVLLLVNGCSQVARLGHAVDDFILRVTDVNHQLRVPLVVLVGQLTLGF
jgi:hypothetical protein